MTDDLLTVELRDGVAVLEWHRPEKRNALSRRLLELIDARLEELSRDHPLTPVVLHGERYFSAGADAGEMATDPDSYREGLGALHISIGDRLREHPAPTIAAVESFALGGGLVIAASADLVVAADDARFGLTEARVGLIGGLGAVTDLVGRLAATRLVLLGHVLSASEALGLGLVTELVPPGAALARAEELARSVLELNPDAWTRAKRLLRGSEPAADLRVAEADANAALITDSAWTRERLAGFAR